MSGDGRGCVRRLGFQDVAQALHALPQLLLVAALAKPLHIQAGPVDHHRAQLMILQIQFQSARGLAVFDLEGQAFLLPQLDHGLRTLGLAREHSPGSTGPGTRDGLDLIHEVVVQLGNGGPDLLLGSTDQAHLSMA